MDTHIPHARPLTRVVPPTAPLSIFNLLRTVLRNPMEAWPDAVYREKIVRRDTMGIKTVFLSDPDGVREVLVEKPDEFIRTTTIDRSGLKAIMGEGLLTTDGPRWRWQRRTAAPIFRHDRLLGFVPAMHEAAAMTRDRWAKLAPGAEIELTHDMMRTTFDIIVATMLPGAQTLSANVVQSAAEDVLFAVGWTNAYGLFNVPSWMPYPGQRKAGRARDVLRGMVRTALDSRNPDPSQAADLLTYLANALDPETGASMDDEQVIDNILTFILAGHETTALALTWTFYLLSHHPETQDALLDEIMAVTGGGSVEAAHLDKLVLTKQVVQESMRLYPPAAVIGRIARQDMTIGGEAIEAGSVVLIPIYAIHRHHALWPDPERFDPSRFTADNVQKRHRYAYLPFAAGQHICIGMGFALMEAAVVLATLLPAAKLSLRSGFDPGLKLRITLRTAHGMPMSVTAR